MYKNAWYMRLCALSRCIFSPSEYAFTINRQGRNTGGTAQASSGRRENPAAVADPLRELPAQATGRLQTDQKAETLRPPQSVQAAEDPRRKAGRLQTSSGHCGNPAAVGRSTPEAGRPQAGSGQRRLLRESRCRFESICRRQIKPQRRSGHCGSMPGNWKASGQLRPAGSLRLPGESRCRRGFSAGDPARKLEDRRRDQASAGYCGSPSAVADPLCREECQRKRAQIRPLRPPQAVSERRESHSAIICTDEKKKAAAGASGCRCQIHAAARSDQEGQAAQDAVGNPAAGKSHIGKLAGSRGRRSGLRDAQTGSGHCGNPAAVADPLREIPQESGKLQADQARSGRSGCRRTGSGS